MLACSLNISLEIYFRQSNHWCLCTFISHFKLVAVSKSQNKNQGAWFCDDGPLFMFFNEYFVLSLSIDVVSTLSMYWIIGSIHNICYWSQFAWIYNDCQIEQFPKSSITSTCPSLFQIAINTPVDVMETFPGVMWGRQLQWQWCR